MCYLFQTHQSLNSSPCGGDSGVSELSVSRETLGGSTQKKTLSRRNAWGNSSYAELITKAIEGSPDGRATLGMIYDWMVKNVSYFRDKGESSSSAGWKVTSECCSKRNVT